MAKVRSVFRCQECGGPSPKWVGRCPSCGAWNTLVEELDGRSTPAAVGRSRRAAGGPVPIAEVDSAEWQPRSTGIGELDRVLGGGLVPGSVTLLGGEPGIGKSTLLLQVVARSWPASAPPCSTSSAEESTQQVRLRAERLGTLRARPVAGHRDRPAPPARPRRRGRARRAWWSTRSRPCYDPELRLGARARSPRCASARPGWSRLAKSRRPRRRARRPRHQGRRAGRAAGARAPGRHRAVVRGRSPPRPAPAAGRQAPLRLHRRARRVRDDRATGCAAVPDPSGLFLADRRAGVAGLGRRAHARGAPPAAGRGAGPGGRAALPSPAPLGPGRRRRPAGRAAGRARAAGRRRPVGGRRVRAGRRRRAGGRAGGRSGRRAGRRVVAA